MSNKEIKYNTLEIKMGDGWEIDCPICDQSIDIESYYSWDCQTCGKEFISTEESKEKINKAMQVQSEDYDITLEVKVIEENHG